MNLLTRLLFLFCAVYPSSAYNLLLTSDDSPQPNSGDETITQQFCDSIYNDLRKTENITIMCVND